MKATVTTTKDYPFSYNWRKPEGGGFYSYHRVEMGFFKNRMFPAIASVILESKDDGLRAT